MISDKKQEKREEAVAHYVGLHQNAPWKFAVAALIILIYMIPLYVLFTMSFKGVSDTSTRLSLPQVWVFDNYISIIMDGTIFRAYLNSGIVAVGTTVCDVVLASVAAYPLARNQSKLNKLVSNIFLGVMIVPPLTILVGVYTFLNGIHALNTYWGIILTLVAFNIPTSVFLYTNFIKSIPRELDEASIVDGASVSQTFFKIILPQLKPITATIIILHGVGAWNEYAYSMYVMQKPDLMTITLTIRKYFSGVQTNYGGACAAAVLAILPMIIIYVCLQDTFIQSQADSAVKG